jgi:hypothetical protein
MLRALSEFFKNNVSNTPVTPVPNSNPTSQSQQLSPADSLMGTTIVADAIARQSSPRNAMVKILQTGMTPSFESATNHKSRNPK